MARQGQILACPEAEQAVLGALLIDHSAIYEVQAILQPDDFANEGHRRTYCAMLALLQQNKRFDYVSLHDELTRTSQLDMVGDGGNRGAAYLTWLINAVPTSAHAAHYAQIVHDYAMRRALMQAAGQIAKLAHDEQNATEAITKSLMTLSAIKGQTPLQMQSMSEVIDAFTVKAQAWLTEPNEIWGLSTGIRDLDQLTGGLEPGELVLVAGRPGMGKSSLALQIAHHIAKQGHGVAFFSLEMNESQLAMRLTCSQAHLDSMAVRRGKLSSEETDQFWREMARIQSLPIWWCCHSQITTAEAMNEVAKLQIKQGINMVIFDYLQLAKAEGENQNLRVSSISQGLKNMAITLNVCVLAVSQLNRAIEIRLDSAPRLSDLRDSGSLEADADKVLFIHREKKGEVKVVLAKNRNGAAGTGLRDLVFLDKYTLFVDKAQA